MGETAVQIGKLLEHEGNSRDPKTIRLVIREINALPEEVAARTPTVVQKYWEFLQLEALDRDKADIVRDSGDGPPPDSFASYLLEQYPQIYHHVLSGI